MLDIGGEFDAARRRALEVEEECRRVLPVIDGLVAQARLPLSIDTRNSEVMRRAAASGVALINDVSALRHDPNSLAVAAQTGLPVVLMHAQGDPRTMQDAPAYADVVLDVFRLSQASGSRPARPRALPGAGLFLTPASVSAKRWRTICGCYASPQRLPWPGMCAAARGLAQKFYRPFDRRAGPGPTARDRLAAALLGTAQGVQILRVHDVAATRQALAVWAGG